jgi:hypothetical protein
MPGIPPYLLFLELETTRNGYISEIGATLGDQQFHAKGGNAKTLADLADFAGSAGIVVGHNLAYALDALRDLNQIHQQETGDPETLTRIAQYELAFRMQTEVPGIMDISKEPQKILDLYGAKPGHISEA